MEPLVGTIWIVACHHLAIRSFPAVTIQALVILIASVLAFLVVGVGVGLHL